MPILSQMLPLTANHDGDEDGDDDDYDDTDVYNNNHVHDDDNFAIKNPFLGHTDIFLV